MCAFIFAECVCPLCYWLAAYIARHYPSFSLKDSFDGADASSLSPFTGLPTVRTVLCLCESALVFLSLMSFLLRSLVDPFFSGVMVPLVCYMSRLRSDAHVHHLPEPLHQRPGEARRQRSARVRDRVAELPPCGAAPLQAQRPRQHPPWRWQRRRGGRWWRLPLTTARVEATSSTQLPHTPRGRGEADHLDAIEVLRHPDEPRLARRTLLQGYKIRSAQAVRTRNPRVV